MKKNRRLDNFVSKQRHAEKELVNAIDNNNIIEKRATMWQNREKFTYPNGLVTIVIEITSW
ncbi:MAG: hypothetical protein EOP45_19010 [Sphingobacteriaceae bacterium]|nr:MAG: hypothetical protein EOP45_19010 [Sphingobacteriaceae bacterium]